MRIVYGEELDRELKAALSEDLEMPVSARELKRLLMKRGVTVDNNFKLVRALRNLLMSMATIIVEVYGVNAWEKDGEEIHINIRFFPKS